MNFLEICLQDLFHGIYKQQIEPQKAKRVIIVIASVAIVVNYSLAELIIFQRMKYQKNLKLKEKKEVKKPEIKKEVKKPEIEKKKK